jgi:hypothetical protein
MIGIGTRIINGDTPWTNMITEKTTLKLARSEKMAVIVEE